MRSAEADSAAYARDREAFFAARPHFWADLDGSEYALFGADAVTAASIEAMRACAADVARVLTRTAPLLRALDDDAFALLGIPPEAAALARDVWPLPELTIARVDMIERPGGTFAAIECNADTPAFVFETHVMNGELCRAFGLRDPNAGAEDALLAALRDAIAASIGALDRDPGREPYVAFTAHRRSREDRETTRYQHALVRRLGGMRTAFVPLDDLRVDENGLYDAAGARIDVLYRHYPIEGFVADRDAGGERPGDVLCELVLRRKLALLNPPSGFLLQSKAVQAVIWGLYESGAYFAADERAAIARSFVPTYCDPVCEVPYVMKPALGREGALVSIVSGDARGVPENAHAPMVYQRYVPMPRTRVMTLQGERACSVLDTCFIVAGRPTAIGRRLGGPITDARAYFRAVGVREPRAR